MKIFKNTSCTNETELLQTAKENMAQWLERAKLTKVEKEELTKLSDKDIIRNFTSLINFGTAGLRGVMKAGLSNMNVYTVSLVTQALAGIIKQAGGEVRGVAIAYDNRNNSELFSHIAAEVLAGNGIKVYCFDSLRPTPELSFAIRHLGCQAGINITASHNTKEYNGYKVYWEDGAQMPPVEAAKVFESSFGIDFWDGISKKPWVDAVEDGSITIIGKEVDEEYLARVLEQSKQPDVIKESDLKIVYTPLHGAGHKLVPEVLDRAGFKAVSTVPEQMIIDGNFPTVDKPNPQFPAAFELAKKTAKDGCDIIIATDPDADRMGAAIPNGDGEYTVLSGNEIGILLTDYLIRSLKEKGSMPQNPCIVKSIVSSELAGIICTRHDVEVCNVYTGFKYIGEKIKEFEEKGNKTFLFGFEESYGYLCGTYARDKDAVVASLLIAEAAAYHKKDGKTLLDVIDEIYNTYGYRGEFWDEYKITSPDFAKVNSNIMASLADNPPRQAMGLKLHAVYNYKKQLKQTVGGKDEKINMASDNTLAFEYEDGSKIIVRPSGTEPKIKLYFFLKAENKAKGLEKLAEAKKAFDFSSFDK